MPLSRDDLLLAAAIIREDKQFSDETGRDPARLDRIADALTPAPVRQDWCEACANDPAGQRWLCPNVANHKVL